MPSIEYWANFLLLLEIFGPWKVILDYVMVMVVALHFNWNVNGLYDGFCMVVGVMFHRHMYTDPMQVNYCQLVKQNVAQKKNFWIYYGSYLDALPRVSLAKNVTKIIVTAMQEKIYKINWKSMQCQYTLVLKLSANDINGVSIFEKAPTIYSIGLLILSVWLDRKCWLELLKLKLDLFSDKNVH